MYLVPVDRLKEVLKKEYGIEAKVVDVSGWGFRTVAYYLEDTAGRKYIGKTAQYSEDKRQKALKDLYFASLLKDTIPTQNYLKNASGGLITVFDESMLRIADFVEGACPFDMSLDIIGAMAEHLKNIHDFNLSKVGRELEKVPCDKPALLHGDLTPSNLIMAGPEVACIMDFEDMLIGPIEYDLAKTAVFGWFRATKVPFEQILASISTVYPGEVSDELLNKYALEHAKHYMEQVSNNKEKYEDENNWKDDYTFAKFAFETISSALK